MARSLRAFAHSYCSLHVHMVFVTKYRHPVLTEQIEADMIQLCRSICEKNRSYLLEAKADLKMKDHIHLLIDIAPDVSVSKLANTMKTVTSREIRKRFADELTPYYWKPVFWKRGYCAVSGGGATLEVIKSYIEAQGKDD
ncbi:MAG: IS200/IS605 family transposase [Geitlerinemataceae cyanobacterium]